MCAFEIKHFSLSGTLPCQSMRQAPAWSPGVEGSGEVHDTVTKEVARAQALHMRGFSQGRRVLAWRERDHLSASVRVRVEQFGFSPDNHIERTALSYTFLDDELPHWKPERLATI